MILPGGATLVERYSTFREGLSAICTELQLSPESLTFRDLTNLVVAWLKNNPLEPSSAD